MSGHRRRPPQRSVGGTRAGGDRATGHRAAHRDQAPRQDMPRRARSRAPQKKRRIDYPRRGTTGRRRWLPSVRQLLSLFLLFFGATAAAVGDAYATVTIPDPNPDDTAAEQRLLLVGRHGPGDRRQRQPAERVALTGTRRRAVGTSSPRRTPPSTPTRASTRGESLRAVVHMAAGGSVQSLTITQQFVKNTYLDQSQTVSRKFKELLISTKIGAGMTKERILQGYLNTCFFGRQANGIQAAARMYYGLPVERLDAREPSAATS